MRLPTLSNRAAQLQTVEAWLGYNHNLQIGSSEFYDMENMTSDFYPVLSPRRKRKTYLAPQNAQGMIAKDTLCYVDGGDLVGNGYHVDMKLSTAEKDCPKKMVSMGAYIIIMPDKKWINTMDLTQFGNIEAKFVTSSDVSFTLCDIEGNDYTGYQVGGEEPTEPENSALWMDTSATPHTLKQYSASTGVWASVTSTYVKIFSPGLGAAFSEYDGVTISGILDERLQDLNSSLPIWAVGKDYIVVVGILDTTITQSAAQGHVTVERKMPNLDFIIEHENRLWGCRYGVAATGQVVNEIYASKLGDFKNWNCFMGVSTDSYIASCGTDGPWTGAITHLGYPLFFKEGVLHKVYGNYPSNFQIQSTELRGVQRGCSGSLASVNEVLYYKALSGIVAYDGSLPVDVSAAFGTEQYDEAVAGSVNGKYYVSMRSRGTGEHVLFVYDTAKRMWHKEDHLQVTAFCHCRGELYALTGGKILCLTARDGDEEDFSWSVQTGEIGFRMPSGYRTRSLPGSKYISRMTLRLLLTPGSKLTIRGRYDFEDTWETLGQLQGTRLEHVSLPIRPKRCDHMVLRLEGKGDVKVYSLTLHIEEGSELR